MLVLGLHGSPRAKGNTHYLLQTFLAACQQAGAQTAMVAVPRLNLKPCIGCGHCEKKGFCVITDDAMATEVYALLRRADVIVLATPVYFYNVTSQLKALIDRSQAFWSRKYVFKLADPRSRSRGGFVLAAGATKGANLFDGLKLTARYFFDAVNAASKGSLTYRKMEDREALRRHATAVREIETAAQQLVAPYLARRRILFYGPTGACWSMMAAAFSNFKAGERIEAVSAGRQPAARIDAGMQEAMQAKGIDLAFYSPQSADQALADVPPHIVVAFNGDTSGLDIRGERTIAWNIPVAADRTPEALQSAMDEIEKRVDALLEEILAPA